MEAQNEPTTPTVEEAVGLVADGILEQIGKADPPKETPQVKADEPTDAVGEHSEETVTGSATEPNPAPVKTEKIKWQGQEVELPADEIKKLAQMGFDYTKKTQELADRQAKIAPYEGFVNLFQKDPTLAAEVATLIQQRQNPPEPKKPTFDDPIEQLKWETRQEVMKEVEEKFIKPLGEHQKQLTHQQVINQVKSQVQADPDYAKVQKSIVDYVQSLPPMIQRTTMLQLDQDPNAYLEAFNHFRGKLAKPQKTESPTPVAKTEKAPILESTGQDTPTSGNAEKTQRLTRQKTKALASGDPTAIADWLLKSGSLDNLM